MNGRRYQIEYGASALADLDALSAEARAQVFRKIDRLQHGLVGNIKRLRGSEAALSVCAWVTTGSCSTWKVMLLSSARSEIGRTFMTKTLEREITRKVRQKREELAAVREEVEDLMDYLDLLEARAKDSGKSRLSHEEAKKRYGIR